METNFEELLNNTNLTPTEILEYYLEEIDERFKEFNENFTNFMPNYKYGNEVYYYIFKECVKKNPSLYRKLESMSENIGTLVKEFLQLYYMIEKTHNSIIYELISEKKNSLNFLENFINLHLCGICGLSSYTMKIHTSIENLIMYTKKQEEKENTLREQESIRNGKIAILEFFVDEFSRELDEKEERIYELEAARFQDTNDINALVSENNELRRVLALNTEGENNNGNN